MSERGYQFLQVFGKLGGMNQAGWPGSVADEETTMSRNIINTVDGEWRKRKGYYRKATISQGTGDVLKLHWHTDEAADQTDATTWLETGDEVTTASSGALDVADITLAGTDTIGGESGIGYIYPTAATSYVKILETNGGHTNFSKASGRLIFYLQKAYNYPTPVQWRNSSLINEYFFYFDPTFNFYQTPDDNFIWKYGDQAGDYLSYPTTNLYTNSWYKFEFRWDNAAAGTIFPKRFAMFINDVEVAGWDGAQVTNDFDDAYFFNTPGGSAAPYTPALGSTFYFMALISSYATTGASTAPITGIYSNSSQNRALVTAGTGVYYGGGTSYTLGTAKTSGAAVTVANTRTSGTEWLGNYYIVDGTTQMVNVEAAGTGGADRLLEAITLPETAKFITSFHGHLWIGYLGTSGAYSVRCSDIDSDSSWTQVNQVFKCKDTVRGIHPHGGSLIVGTKTSIEAISGYQPHDFAKTVISSCTGCASHWSMAEVPLSDYKTEGLIWAAYDGVYMLIGEQIQKISQPIDAFWKTLAPQELEECCAVDDRDNNQYLLAVSDGKQTENNWILAYNYRVGTWSIFKTAHNLDVLGWYYSTARNRYLLGGDSGGNVYQLNYGENDNGSSIDGYVLTKWHDAGAPDQEKDFRKLYVWYEPTGDWVLTVGWSVDYRESSKSSSVVVGTDGLDYACTLDHGPDVVVGEDGNDYYCIVSHTSATQPPTDATNWAAAGTTGRGETWATSTDYVANTEKKPITGANYTSYWKPNNTVGQGATWSASAEYVAEAPEFNGYDYIDLSDGSAQWDSSQWDAEAWGDTANTKMAAIDLYGARGKSIRFMFRNAGLDQPVVLRGYKVWFTTVPEFPA